ncbi:putative DNA modification/repair radical SAM protein [Comamonas sp. Y33R10-2]|uniref:putative DNA modification/repair radical SAM protein n=1 Tax=Comamonas sp. Y33R10-2 TaxID=2853257 RepID=UPI001C5C9094|nr:putative DNA modification/repair radical SAM protein [Comamonas sp. Y33R10-2]QXZ11321.1 putative DNA modification/repair radical SAM protein [Comamonas sp. Y33R10-2]
MEIIAKLSILADAAKYDASCASSGVKGRNSLGGKGMGSSEGMGICHSYAPDGRCISLLKILLTNFCIYDCRYCINRKSSNVQRARFTAAEVVELTLDFYRRNCIEGLFLSSGIIQSSDYTMEQMVEVARSLREDHDFRGYIHLKTIPDAAPELLALAGRYADRLSINIELPTQQGLQQLAPEKDANQIQTAMGDVARFIQIAKDEGRSQAARSIVSLPGAQRVRRAKAPRYAPGGQSTQMIVGADDSSDAAILQTSSGLYGGHQLRRVYYSAFSPIPDASADLPLQAPPLLREHRLYQADWLMRFYGFAHQEIVLPGSAGMLDLEVDPKLAWALANRQHFPVNLNLAPKEWLLRVPGLGVRSVQRLLLARRGRSLRLADLQQLRTATAKVLAFVELTDYHPRRADLESPMLRQQLLQRMNNGVVQQKHSGMRLPDTGLSAKTAQLSLFDGW